MTQDRSGASKDSTTNYVCGYNMPGYLPEMEPAWFDNAEDAKRYMIAELDRSGDHWFDGDEADKALADEASSDMEDLNLSDVSEGWSTVIGNLVFWINPTNEEIPEDEL